MRLHRLVAQNFRGFERLDLTFDEQLTVIVGANGAGKTSVLDAVAAVLGKKFMGNAAPGWALDEGDITARSAMPDGRAAGCRIQLEGRTSAGSEYLQVGIGATPRVILPKRPFWGAMTPVLMYRVNRSTAGLTPGSTDGSSWGPGDSSAGWNDCGASYADFFRWFREVEDLNNQEIARGRQPVAELKAVRDAVSRLLPSFEDLRIERVLPPFADRPVLVVDKGGLTLPLDALSEGERTTIAMVADIARRLALSFPGKPVLEREAVVFIDEIELHLHPRWQRDLLGRLRRVFPNVQWIVTTHSPIVVSEVGAKHLRVLDDFELVPPSHDYGRDANAVLEDLFEVPARPTEVRAKLDQVERAVDDGALEKAEQALAELVSLLGGSPDPDVSYYRALIQRLREETPA